jgi:hypothetical protein
MMCFPLTAWVSDFTKVLRAVCVAHECIKRGHATTSRSVRRIQLQWAACLFVVHGVWCLPATTCCSSCIIKMTPVLAGVAATLHSH